MKNKERSKALNKTALVWDFVEAALLMVVGLLLIIFSSDESLRKSVYLVVGMFLSLSGITRIVLNILPYAMLNAAQENAKVDIMKNFKLSMLVLGASELALGITFIVFYIQKDQAFFDSIAFFISNLVSIILMVVGLSFMVTSIVFFSKKLNNTLTNTLLLLLSIGLIVLGVLVLIFINDAAILEQITLIVIGIIFIVTAIASICHIVLILKTNKRLKEKIEKIKTAEEIEDKTLLLEEKDKTTLPDESTSEHQ